MKYFIVIFISIVILFNVYNLGKKSVKISEVVKTDTITKVDTVIVEKPIPDTIYLTKIVTDTVYSTDSVKVEVQLPIETKTYTDDSTYNVQISGFKAELDKIEVFPRTTTIYKEKVQEIALKRPIINHSLQVGVGYGMIHNKPDLFIGYGISINF
jgi:hypothetical protein